MQPDSIQEPFMFQTDPGQSLSLPVLFFVASWLATIAIHVVFAVGVTQDAIDLRHRGVATSLVSPAWWTLVTLFGGVFVAALYWLIHHSTLRREPQSKEAVVDHSGLD